MSDQPKTYECVNAAGESVQVASLDTVAKLVVLCGDCLYGPDRCVCKTLDRASAWRPPMGLEMEMESATCSVLAASWSAAKRQADVYGSVLGNAATIAGQYLELASGDPTQALEILPKDVTGDFWQRVRNLLIRASGQ